jgi:hypothetical protein
MRTDCMSSIVASRLRAKSDRTRSTERAVRWRERGAFLISHTGALSVVDVRFFGAGLERLQQLLDAMTDDGQIVRQHVYRVNDDMDAYHTLQRLSNRSDDVPKHILIDLPTAMTELLLNRQVCSSLKSRRISQSIALRVRRDPGA